MGKTLQDFVKLNVDASFYADDLCGATGGVIRDSHGSFISARNSKIDHVNDILSAEALALKQGLILAQTVGCDRAICCSNSMDVIQAMEDGGYSNGSAAAIFDDCYHLASYFLKIQFEHNYREANQVAHELARVAGRNDQSVWLDEPPSFLLHLFLKDVTHVINESIFV
jgi:ribonuclease HI